MRLPIPALCLLLTLTGCGASVKPPLSRTLPPRESVVPEASPLPPVRPGVSWRVTAGENRAVAAENARRLEAAGRNYDAVRKSYEAGE